MAAVVGFLVISFAIWGIGDIFRGFGRSTFAKIGSTEVTIEQFRQIYNDRLQQLSRRLGQPLSMEQARARGYDRAIIGEFIAQIVLDERAKALRLGITDAEISKRITGNPAFQAVNGQFDRARFSDIIRQMGYTEARFISEQRRELVRRQLEETIKGASILPKAAVEAADRYQNEQRAIEYVLLDRAKAGEIAPPTPEVLAKYFEDRKFLFRAPEYRKIVVVTVLPSEQARTIEIGDAELRRAYDRARGVRASGGRPGGAPWWRPSGPGDSGPAGREMERLAGTVSKVLLSAVVIVIGLALARLLRSPTLDLADLLGMILLLLQIWRQVSPAGRV